MRLLVGLLGMVLMLVLVVVGLFVGLGMLVFAAVRRLFRSTPRPAGVSNTLDGEYTVVEKRSATLGMR